MDVASLDGNNGFRVSGANEGDRFAQTSAMGGDVNGDGIDDVILGAPEASPNGTSSGATYVIFGNRSDFDPAFDVTSLDGAIGFVIRDENAEDLFGWSVSIAGDVNADGVDDLVVGAVQADNDGASVGVSYVIPSSAQRPVSMPSLKRPASTVTTVSNSSAKHQAIEREPVYRMPAILMLMALTT